MENNLTSENYIFDDCSSVHFISAIVGHSVVKKINVNSQGIPRIKIKSIDTFYKSVENKSDRVNFLDEMNTDEECSSGVEVKTERQTPEKVVGFFNLKRCANFVSNSTRRLSAKLFNTESCEDHEDVYSLTLSEVRSRCKKKRKILESQCMDNDHHSGCRVPIETKTDFDEPLVKLKHRMPKKRSEQRNGGVDLSSHIASPSSFLTFSSSIDFISQMTDTPVVKIAQSVETSQKVDYDHEIPISPVENSPEFNGCTPVLSENEQCIGFTEIESSCDLTHQCLPHECKLEDTPTASNGKNNIDENEVCLTSSSTTDMECTYLHTTVNNILTEERQDIFDVRNYVPNCSLISNKNVDSGSDDATKKCEEHPIVVPPTIQENDLALHGEEHPIINIHDCSHLSRTLYCPINQSPCIDSCNEALEESKEWSSQGSCMTSTQLDSGSDDATKKCEEHPIVVPPTIHENDLALHGEEHPIINIHDCSHLSQTLYCPINQSPFIGSCNEALEEYEVSKEWSSQGSCMTNAQLDTTNLNPNDSCSQEHADNFSLSAIAGVESDASFSADVSNINNACSDPKYQSSDNCLVKELEQAPKKLLSNRKVISPSSRERLCRATDADELYGSMQFLRSRKRLLLEKFPSLTGPMHPKSIGNPERTTKKVRSDTLPTKSILKAPIATCRKSSAISAKSSSNVSDYQAVIKFSQRQMHDIEYITGKLVSQLKSMKGVLAEILGSESFSPSVEDEHKLRVATEDASLLETSTEKYMTMMAKDHKRFCKIMMSNEHKTPAHIDKPSKKAIMFADEAGGVLCHVKFFEDGPDTDMVAESPTDNRK